VILFHLRLVSDLFLLFGALRLIPAYLIDSRYDRHVGFGAVLIRDDSLSGNKGVRQHTDGSARLAKKTNAIEVHVDRNHKVSAEISHVSNRQVRYQSTINQETSFSIANRNVKSRNASAGANRERQVAFVAKHDRRAFH